MWTSLSADADADYPSPTLFIFICSSLTLYVRPSGGENRQTLTPPFPLVLARAAPPPRINSSEFCTLTASRALQEFLAIYGAPDYVRTFLTECGSLRMKFHGPHPLPTHPVPTYRAVSGDIANKFGVFILIFGPL